MRRRKQVPFKHLDPIEEDNEYDDYEGEDYDDEDIENWINKELKAAQNVTKVKSSTDSSRREN